MSLNTTGMALLGALCVAANAQVSVVRQPLAATAALSSPYIVNREPLQPSRFVRLPVGSIEPRGWLRQMLETQRDGMTGRLAEISPWLRFEGNAWAEPEDGHSGWEEMPYWLKGYGDLGYVLKDEAIIAEARRWIEAILATAQPDGWFGPLALKTSIGGQADLWPNMVVLNILQTFHEATGDERVIPFMTNYFRWQLDQPAGDGFVAGYWPKMRVGDNIESVLWTYNRTGDAWLLDLARKLHTHAARWDEGVANWHGVNITQGFREPVNFWQLDGSYRLLSAAERNWQQFMGLYGQMAGGGFATDENARPGYDDPRQGFETCSIVEGMHSYQMLMRMTGHPVWADRSEELAFNTMPASMTPEQTGLRYLTAANQPQSDHHNHSPGIENRGTMLSFSPWQVYRCCQHNVSHGWPYYAEELWTGSADGGLLTALYAASQVTAQVAGGHEVTITEETEYPFGETVTLSVDTAAPVNFPLYLRIPRWAANASVTLNGAPLDVQTEPLSYVRIEREWQAGDRVVLTLPMRLAVRTWEQQHGAVTVDRGPISYSLRIGENWERYGGTDEWPEFDVLPTTPWNYGLVLDPVDPTANLEVVERPGRVAANPFRQDSVPIVIRAQARRIPEWGFDEHDLISVLQQSPARSREPVETVELIPMGAARLRLAVFPTVAPDGQIWLPPDRAPVRASHVFGGDTIAALTDGLEPANSADRDIPRHTFWPNVGTSEWIELNYAEPRELSSVAVYWYNDEAAGGHCRPPAAWRVVYRDGDEWVPVSEASGYGLANDTYNTVTFVPVTTDGLRLEIDLQPELSVGILEVRAQ